MNKQNFLSMTQSEYSFSYGCCYCSIRYCFWIFFQIPLLHKTKDFGIVSLPFSSLFLLYLYRKDSEEYKWTDCGNLSKWIAINSKYLNLILLKKMIFIMDVWTYWTHILNKSIAENTKKKTHFLQNYTLTICKSTILLFVNSLS